MPDIQMINNPNSYTCNYINTNSIYTADGTNLEKILVDIHNREDELSEKNTENNEQILHALSLIRDYNEQLLCLGDHIFNKFPSRLTEHEVRFEKLKKDNTNIILFLIIYTLIMIGIVAYLIVQIMIVKENIKDLNDRQNMYNINEINDDEGMSEKIVYDYPEDYK